MALKDRCKKIIKIANEELASKSFVALNVHSSLSAVGLLAVITKNLAQAGIGVNVVSAFYHDHLFVPTERLEDAMDILSGLASEKKVKI